LSLNTVAEFISRVQEICALEQERENPFIFVAGPVNAGKSTLVNGLLGERICPDDASPSTLFPVYFRYADSPSACKTIRGRTVQLPERELRETLRNRRRSQIPDRAEIHLPAGLLRWCTLVDTPGIGLGEQSDRLVLDLLSKADGIVFLFHQRGIDAGTQHFLSELAAVGLKGWISFWVNANLGHIDGTSLTETGQALKSIFPGRSEVQAVNTRDRASTGLLSHFLQVKALEAAVRLIEAGISQRDRLIPGLLERASLVEDEERFLIKLWDVLEKADTINTSRQAIRDLPLIYGSLINLLRANTCRLTIESPVTQGLKKNGRAAPPPGEKVASLIREMQCHRDLARHADLAGLGRAAAKLGDKCRVMVAGPFSTGKTTFLNALLGETLLPAEDRATTSCTVRAGYGDQKTATVEYLYQAQFQPLACRGGKYSLDRQEVLAITGILDNPQLRELVSQCQVCRGGVYQRVSLAELGELINTLCQSYGKGSGGGKNTPKGFRVPLFSRRVAESSLPAPPISEVCLTMGSLDRRQFRLDHDRQRLEFYRTISPPGSFLVESVNLTCPSPHLALADFIDTPGLDSTHKRHYERAARALSAGDLVLIFLHAKHLLAGQVPGQIGLIKQTAQGVPVFYVVNFADTITAVESEKISLQIRQKLGRHSAPGEIIPYPQVYFISALKALRREDEGFDRMIRRLHKKIEEIQGRKAEEAIAGVNNWLEEISDPARQKNATQRARQAARHYRGELERILKSHL